MDNIVRKRQNEDEMAMFFEKRNKETEHKENYLRKRTKSSNYKSGSSLPTNEIVVRIVDERRSKGALLMSRY